MRLLNTSTLKLDFFFERPPPYVILSHTWGDGEVTFDDIDKPYAKNMAGYEKIVCSCKQAVSDGFEWIWIDTCCIDKRSSAELSEAINSMYHWYWLAEKCYAHLGDTERFDHTLNRENQLRSTVSRPIIRWFTRGWTLQELLAPEIVEFYNEYWELLGTKAQWAKLIENYTGIDTKHIINRHAIQSANIATKFSWVSSRQTTRVEDIAYCLLGLVGVNMAMLYGEGMKAFHRLQLEILRKTNEHSIFAWRGGGASSQIGLLARFPVDFEDSSDICEALGGINREHMMTNKGLKAQLPCIRSSDNRYIAVLNCRRRRHLDPIGIRLKKTGDDQYQRMELLDCISREEVERAEVKTIYIVADEPTENTVDYAFRKIKMNWPDLLTSAYSVESMACLKDDHYSSGSFPTGHFVDIYNCEHFGLLFCRNRETFLLSCRLNGREIWSHIRERVNPLDLKNHIMRSYRKYRRGKSHDLAGDYREWTLSNGTTVIFKTAKKQTEGCIQYDAKIIVSDPTLTEIESGDHITFCSLSN